MTATVSAIANQKGGVGKTTTAQSIAIALAELGRAVLVVDGDPQGSLTFSLGLDPDDLDPTLNDVVTGKTSLVDTIIQTEHVDLVPANIDLAGAEITLLSRTGREYLLRGELADLLDSYDDILVDCSPSLGVLTINALTAADQVIIPVQAETLSHRGVSQLLETIDDVKRLTNRSLTVAGVVATMFDGRTNHAKDVLGDLLVRYDLDLIGAPVRKSVRFAEAPAMGESVLTAAGRQIPGTSAYRIIARDLVGNPIDQELWELARWTAEDRAAVLGGNAA